MPTSKRVMTNPDNYAIDKPIVLVGLMGAGKTTIGRRLAQQLGCEFIDSDHEISEAAGCSISDIFELHGEAIFRDLEKRVIQRLMNLKQGVIATGGGAFINAENREQIRKNGLSVWLKADLPVLLNRVMRRDNRPLLQTGNKSDILQRLIDERYPVYALADMTIDSNVDSHDEVVKRILRKLERAA